MSQEYPDACKAQKPKIGFYESLPSRGNAAKTFEPSDQTLHLPPALVPAQCPPILMAAPACTAQGSDELNTALGAQSDGQLLRVKRPVRDQLLREPLDERGVEGLLDEDTIVSRTICQAESDRKTSAVCVDHELGGTSSTALADESPPFFAGM